MTRGRYGLYISKMLLLMALCAPFVGCDEDVFVYDTSKLYAVDPALIAYRETDSWPVALPAPAYLGIGTNGCLVMVGGQQGIVCSTHQRQTQKTFSWQAPAATAVAVAPDGRIFVGASNCIVSVSASTPNVVNVWTSLGENARIAGIAADANNVWACDAAQRTVWRFDTDGRLLGQLPAPRQAAFVVPSPSFPVATRGDGFFWVANPGRHELRLYATDGALRSAWSCQGMMTPGLSGCCNPAYVALLPDGNLVTSEKKLPRIKIYGTNGTFRCVVAPPSSLPGGEGRPVAVDADGRIFVLDGLRMRVFEKKQEWKSP